MKKNVLIIFLLIGLLSVKAQSPQEKAEVLKLCTDLTELQSYMEDADGNPLQQLYIMDCKNEFGDITGLSKFGSPILFIDKQNISDESVDAYLQFFIFEVNEDNARVDFKLIRKNASPRVVQVILQLAGNGANWVIETKKIEEK